jgi:glycosyltransferase involved in cell wall biosynthesis
MSRATMLVFTRPSSLQADYGFSTKLGEYLATGRPVIATRTGEVEKYLKDGQNAFICDPNENSIAEKICAISENYSLALKVGEEGRQCALRYFNNKIIALNAIEQVQQSLL